MRLNEENRATKGKMIQIQKMMQERRLRRQAKREARSAPFPPQTTYSPNSKRKMSASTSHRPSSEQSATATGSVKAPDTQMSAPTVSESSDVTMTNDGSSTMYEDYKPGAMVA